MSSVKMVDLTSGSIMKNLLKVIIPITITNLLNMLYNLTDLFWIGKISTSAIAAVGTAGLFIWASFGFIVLAKLGTEIRVSQSFGKSDTKGVKKYAISGIKFGFLIAISYGILIVLFRSNLIDIFNIENKETANQAKDYLLYTGFSAIFICMNQVFISIFNALGNTKSVLIITGSGLIVNMILDPLFIFVFKLGTIGAGIATLIASTVPVILFLYLIIKKTDIFKEFKFKLDTSVIREYFKLGFVPMVHNIMFTMIGMVVSYYVIRYGDSAIGAQRLGVQIESLTWMIGNGVAAGLAVFVGQNFGAKKWERLVKGFKGILICMTGYAIFTTVLFMTSADFLMRLFTEDSGVIEKGIAYIFIASFSQIGMIYEGLGVGVLNGVSKTNIPAFFSISGNLLRIPLILVLTPIFGLNGIWIALTASCIYKGFGIMIVVISYFVTNKNIKRDYFF